MQRRTEISPTMQISPPRGKRINPLRYSESIRSIQNNHFIPEIFSLSVSLHHFLLSALIDRNSKLRRAGSSRDPLPAAVLECEDGLVSIPPEWWSLCCWMVEGRLLLPPLLEWSRLRFWSLNSPEEVGLLADTTALFDEPPLREEVARVLSKLTT